LGIEMEITNKIKHPNLITVHGVILANEQIYATMELLELGNLSNWLQKAPQSDFNAALILKFSLESALAMVVLEEKKYIHRQICAKNFYLTSDLRLKLADFGILGKMQQAEKKK